MKSGTYRFTKAGLRKRYGLIFLVGLLLYGLLFGAGFSITSGRFHKESGLFTPGQTYAGENYAESLDLRVAAQAKYPSSPLTKLRYLGKTAGGAEWTVSFSVSLDHLTEYGLMILPDTPQPAKGFPAIILCHGYANPARYKTTSGYISDMQFYAEHGFAVIKPDYRGQGLSLHHGSPNSGYYSMVYNTDVMSLLSSLKQTSFIDGSNISLWGHSLGAYIALRAAVLSPDIRNVILLSGPVDSLSKMYLTYIPPSDENNLNALKTRQQVFAKYGPPTANTDFWKNASPITFVGRIKARVQINVGSLDQVVPPEFSADLSAALTKAGLAHGYYVYPTGDHSLAAQRNLIWTRSLQILQSQP